MTDLSKYGWDVFLLVQKGEDQQWFIDEMEALRKDLCILPQRWHMEPILIDSLESTLARIKATPNAMIFLHIDNPDSDALSCAHVVRRIEELQIPLIGGSSKYVLNTSSKIRMKKLMVAAGVNTSPCYFYSCENGKEELIASGNMPAHEPESEAPDAECKFPYPLIVKTDLASGW